MVWHYLQAAILGIVQGLTEFIPVSSSGHLIIAREFLGIPDQGNLFDAILHLATLVAVFIYFRADWISMFQAWINGNRIMRRTRLSRRLLILIVLATLPALLVGLRANQWIESHFRGLLTVAVFMIVVGLIFIVVERLIQPKGNLNQLNWSRALAIGLAQAMAIMPGISRSGATIVTGMYMGLKREVAAKFSFLMAAPIIAAAGGYSLYSAIKEDLLWWGDWLFWLIAFIFSLVFSLLAIKFLLAFLKKYPLNIFAYYLVGIGLILLVFNFIK